MRIGIDYTPVVHQTAGIGRYVRELVRALAAVDHENQYTLFIAGGRVSARDVWGGEHVLLVSDGGDLESQAKQTLEQIGYQVGTGRRTDARVVLGETSTD